LRATHKRTGTPSLDAVASARQLGLRYVTDRAPGIRRTRAGQGFRYVDASGVVVKDPAKLKRFRSLVIPPAWRDVWICPSPEGHLQATGRDQRGRKQYRYHARYRKVRNQTKFDRMPAFADVLMRIRRRVRKDLDGPGLTRTKVLATVVSLLESTCIRVGNEEYAEQNNSFGLTTLRNQHVKIGGETIRFRFRGKSGQVHDIQLRDRKLARIVGQCQCLPGQELFEYLGEDGKPASITSEDVNAYLREACGDDFTAKDFRTWVGTTESVIALKKLGPAPDATSAKKNIVDAVKTVSEKLGNRPATCRAYYIHPAVLDSYEKDVFFDVLERCPGRKNGLRREEHFAVALIESGRRNAPAA
jgi:DNA topoisomerase I